MISRIWRFFVALFDLKTAIRKMTGRPVVDVVFVTNMRDKTDRQRYLGNWHPSEGHFNGPRYWFKGLNGIAGRTRAIDTETTDLLKNEGRKKAKEQLISAIQWAKDNGAKVILLAASTKRFFGESGKKLKEKFPDLIFTIGDNGTALILKKETLRALKEAGLTPYSSKVGVIGPYGFLGEAMVKTLKEEGYNTIGIGSNISILERIAQENKIEVCQSFLKAGKLDAVVACTHSAKVCLNFESINFIRRKGKKLLIIDVAEPPNFNEKEYKKCKDIVVRQDAGNAYSPSLKYVLGATSYKMFRLVKGMTFGCFAEAISLAAVLQRGENIADINWFSVNKNNMEAVDKMFKLDGFIIPPSRCFGKLVKSFNLEIKKS